MKRFSIALLLAAFAATRVVAAGSDSVVTFNEVMYHPLTNETAMEWVELYNQMSVDVDISGWRLDGGIHFSFPPGTIIRGRGYLVVASDPAALQAATGLTGVLGPFNNRLSNTGETIQLKNNSDRLMDSVSYLAEFDWPVAADGAGPSLAKLSPAAPSSEAASWTASARSGGTPGGVNFVTAGTFMAPAGLVSFWNFNDTNSTAADLVGGNNGVAGTGATRVGGLVGSVAFAFGTSSNAYLSVGAGVGNNFSVTDGVTIEALLRPGWSGTGYATIFRKEEPVLGTLVSYWSFDEASSGTITALDPVSGNNGTFLGTATRTTGLAGTGAAQFNNTVADGVSVGTGVNNTLSMSTGITVFARIRPTWSGNSGDYDEIFRKEDGGNRILLCFQNDGNNGSANPPVAAGPVLSFGLNVNGTYSELDMPLDGAAGRPTLAQLKDGATHSVAATYDSATGLKTIWIDGTLRWSVTLSGTITSGGTTAAVIGNHSAGGSEAFSGTIDDVAIWRAALTTNQVSSLASGASPLTIGASANPTASTRLLLAFQNDGDNTNANPPVASGPVLSFGLNVGGVYSELDMPLDGASGRPKLAQLEDGNTHHLAATYDRATGAKGIFVDGTLRFSTTLSGAISSGGSGSAIIGNASAPGAEPFNGTLDEVAFWSRALTPTEVASHFAGAQSGQGYFTNVSSANWPRVAFNELASSTNTDFWLELINLGTTNIDLGGCVIARFGGTNREYVFPAQPLASNSFLQVTKATLGFGVDSGDKLVLYAPDHATVLDAVVAKKEPRARHPDGTGAWLFPSSPTPGASNAFVFHDEIVINEIMYHHRSIPATPAVYSPATNLVLSFTNTWRYYAQGVDLGTAWREPTYDDSAWLTGPALLYVSSSSLPVPKNTALPDKNGSNQRINTYYFRTPFTWAGGTTPPSFSLRTLIDDGAVFYLNGVEVWRQNMPTGAVSYATFAASGIPTASITGPFTLPASSLVAGTNVLAVEVHRVSSIDSDVVFGAELSAPMQLSPAMPGGDSPESWVELFNRSSNTVDLTGWRLDEGIDYRFAAGKTLAPGGYLVIAKDVAYMQALYPSLDVVGPFTNKLSASSSLIVLKDANNNPANSVRYFDGGHWPEYADGGGSSLELRDPVADNNKAESWAASIETGKSAWTNITYRMVASSTAAQPSQWNEFVVGLLDSGESLIDDLSVIESPTNAPVQLIQNGSFETGTAGWRFLGNHRHSEVIVDPSNAGNHVLHLVASGVTEHMHNHIETTLVGNHAVTNGLLYEVSFRARWLAGDSQLNTRLYFNRAARTTLLPVPTLNGTPGARNSTFVTNGGPTFANFQHTRVVPLAGESVTVRIEAGDPQGVASCAVFWSANGGAWQSATMTEDISRPPDSTSRIAYHAFTGTIPGYAAGTVVQFYVRALDGLGAAATYPAAGTNSRALYQVDDGQALLSLAHNVRIIMTPADNALLHALTNVMSNELLGGTVVSDEERAYYDVGIRLKGSERGRDQPARASYHLLFNPYDLFRGVHPVMLVDRSGGWRYGTSFGQDEILINHMINRAGAIPGVYYDLIRVIAPQSAQTGPALFFPRLEDNFLDSQYSHGGNGDVFEFELVYSPTTTSDSTPQGYKLPEPDGVLAVDISDLGDDKEQYRYNYITKINRDRDEFTGLVAFAKSFSLTGAALDTATQQTVDVNQWMRAFAMMSLCGVGDAYTRGNNHNIRLFVRPDDQRVVAFPCDWDFSFVQPLDASLYGDQNLAKIVELPVNQRLFYTHLLDLITTTYDAAYMTYWAGHYSRFCPGQNFSDIPTYIAQRASYVMSQLPTDVPFAITSHSGANFTTSNAWCLLQGTASILVGAIQVNGVTYEPLWTNLTNWTITLPLASGANALVVQGLSASGSVVSNATDAIIVTNLGASAFLPVVINEWMADNKGPSGFPDPADGLFQDWFELFNPNTNAVNLSGLFLTDTLSNPTKWQIPTNVFISGHGFLLVWADNNTNQNSVAGGTNVDLHVCFQLNNSGEVIGLFALDGVTPISTVTFGSQIQNVSQGRFPDGDTNTLYFMTNWTPRVANEWPALQVTGQVELQGYVGVAGSGAGTRVVTFKATDDPGTVLRRWDLTLSFVPGAGGGCVAPFALPNVSARTTHLSAKTAWNLRTRLAVTFSNALATVDFTGNHHLPGGDFDDSNLVDYADFAQLAAFWYTSEPSCDINGSGLVDIEDYFILASRWYQQGGAE